MSGDLKNKGSYNNDSIKSLKGADRVRLKPGVMFGSDNIKGAFHTFKEIVGNSLDEARGGYGNVIDVTYHKDGAITVKDRGRGVPMGWNEKEQAWNWHLVFNELYAGGKYDGKDDAYKYSVGLNGLGAAAVQYVSEYFIVKSYQGNKMYMKEFMEGNPLDEGLYEEDLEEEEQRGTEIKWKIDTTVFRNTNFKFKDFVEYCEGQAHINKVTFNLLDEKSGETVVIEGKGLEYYLTSQLDDKVIEVLTKDDKSEGVEERGQHYSTKCEVCLVITEEAESKQYYFHNTADITTGVHTKATQDAILGFFRNIGKQNSITIMPYDYNNYLSILVSTYSNISSFEGQTKDGVDNPFIYDIIYKTITDLLEESMAKGLDSIKRLTDLVVDTAIARKKAKEFEEQARKIKKSRKKKEKAEKFVDCESKNPKERELFIVEGDSALSSCKDARDGNFQALLPIRGKTLNCLKASLDSILNSPVIKDIISTVGTGVEIGSKKDELFNIDDLQFDKIIFTTDGDVDGFQIRVLLYTIFYRLMPELLRQGKIYIAETPLFEIELTKGESKFAYSVEEKNSIVDKLTNEGIKIKKVHRSKGLGENDPDMLWNTTMNPKTRKLVQLNIDVNDVYVKEMSNMLFGADTRNERKNYILNRLQEGLVDIELAKEAGVLSKEDEELAEAI